MTDSEIPAMAKKKTTTPEGWRSKPLAIQLRGSDEFKAWVEGLAENRATSQYCCGRKEYYFFEDHSVLVHERCCWYTDTVGQAHRDIEDYFAEDNFGREMFA